MNNKLRGLTDDRAVGDDPELEFANQTRLLRRLVLYSSIYILVRLAISWTVLRTSSDAERDLGILALRHQVAVLRRQVKRPDLLPAYRMILPLDGLVTAAHDLDLSQPFMDWAAHPLTSSWPAWGGSKGEDRPQIVGAANGISLDDAHSWPALLRAARRLEPVLRNGLRGQKSCTDGFRKTQRF